MFLCKAVMVINQAAQCPALMAVSPTGLHYASHHTPQISECAVPDNFIEYCPPNFRKAVCVCPRMIKRCNIGCAPRKPLIFWQHSRMPVQSRLLAAHTVACHASELHSVVHNLLSLATDSTGTAFQTCHMSLHSGLPVVNAAAALVLLNFCCFRQLPSIPVQLHCWCCSSSPWSCC